MSPEEYKRKTCTDKLWISNRKQARYIIAKLRQRYGDDYRELYAYRCPFGKHVHLARKIQSK